MDLLGKNKRLKDKTGMDLFPDTKNKLAER
jgi:hypothetical protein